MPEATQSAREQPATEKHEVEQQVRLVICSGDKIFCWVHPVDSTIYDFPGAAIPQEGSISEVCSSVLSEQWQGTGQDELSDMCEVICDEQLAQAPALHLPVEGVEGGRALVTLLTVTISDESAARLQMSPKCSYKDTAAWRPAAEVLEAVESAGYSEYRAKLVELLRAESPASSPASVPEMTRSSDSISSVSSPESVQEPDQERDSEPAAEAGGSVHDQVVVAHAAGGELSATAAPEIKDLLLEMRQEMQQLRQQLSGQAASIFTTVEELQGVSRAQGEDLAQLHRNYQPMCDKLQAQEELGSGLRADVTTLQSKVAAQEGTLHDMRAEVAAQQEQGSRHAAMLQGQEHKLEDYAVRFRGAAGQQQDLREELQGVRQKVEGFDADQFARVTKDLAGLELRVGLMVGTEAGSTPAAQRTVAARFSAMQEALELGQSQVKECEAGVAQLVERQAAFRSAVEEHQEIAAESAERLRSEVQELRQELGQLRRQQLTREDVETSIRPLRHRLREQDPQGTATALREEIRAECAALKAALERLEESVQQELREYVDQAQEMAQNCVHARIWSWRKLWERRRIPQWV